MFNMTVEEYDKYARMGEAACKKKYDELDEQIQKLQNERYAIYHAVSVMEGIENLRKNLEILAKAFIGKWSYVESASYMGNRETIIYGKNIYFEKGNRFDPVESGYQRMAVLDKDGKVVSDPHVYLGLWHVVFEGIVYSPAHSMFPIMSRNEVWEPEEIEKIVRMDDEMLTYNLEIDQLVLKNKANKEACLELLRKYHDETAERLRNFANDAIESYDYLLEHVGDADIDLKRVGETMSKYTADAGKKTE